jgi:signal recognition particle GTPase
MNCEKIEKSIDKLIVDKIGRIRNKRKVMDEIHSMHLTSVDSVLTDVRVFVTQISNSHSTKDALNMIDEFLYKKQIS